MEKPPWVGERPVDPENCVHEPPNLWVKIAWPVKRKWSLWKATRHVSKRYADRNHDEIFGLLKEDSRKLLQKINDDKTMVATEEVFGMGDIYAKAMQMERSLCACINDHGHKKVPNDGSTDTQRERR